MSKRQKQMPVANTLCDMPENILERICSFLVPLDAFALVSTSKAFGAAAAEGPHPLGMKLLRTALRRHLDETIKDMSSQTVTVTYDNAKSVHFG